MTKTPNNRFERPPGLSVIAVLLALLAVSGLLNAFVWSRIGATLPPDAPARLRAAVKILATPVVSVAAIFYAITALCSAVGVWQMRTWAPLAILAWGVGVLTLGVIFSVLGPHLADAPLSTLVLLYAGLGAIAVAIVAATWSYVRRNVARVNL
jgi:hypothetical protein